jgi:hypothetical protein
MSSRYKKGESGNLKGRPPKPKGEQLDVKVLFKKLLGTKTTVSVAGNEQSVTLLEAGLMQLMMQFAKGDAKARRDLFWLAEKYGVNLLEGQEKEIGKLLNADHRAILDSYVARFTAPKERSAEDPEIAPADLLDDDNVKGDGS